jgi:hypothetical protein
MNVYLESWRGMRNFRGMNMSRYAYDYSLTPARATGWRAALTSMTVVGTVMAVSAISGAFVTVQLFAAPAQPRVVRQVAALVPPAPQLTAPHAVSFAARYQVAPQATNHAAAPPMTVAAAPATKAPPPAAPPAQPAPVVALAEQPAPAAVADSELTFAKGYAQRRAIAAGAVAHHGKILIAGQTQLGRAAVKPKPKVYARNTAPTSTTDRRAETARSDAYGMFQRFERPDQFDFSRHQALAFGDQRAVRRRTDAPPARPSGNSPNGMFGGLF